ncbi:MAG TPA: glycosyltransferase family 39 protein [Acidocella sp.]|nr:glycosyltransferase family 39 protein [Acidocella sp.]
MGISGRKPLVLGFAIAALLAASRLAFTFAPVSTDPNEGWNAVHAALAMGGGPLYPPEGALTATNYPPLSFLITGLTGMLTGDMIIAGRLVAIIAIFCAGALIYRISFQISRDKAASAGALLLFTLYNATLCRPYLGMNDPQWLAQAFALAGLAVLLPEDEQALPGARRIALAALLFVAGGFVKQNVVGLPFAVTIWLLVHNKRAFAIWLVCALAALAMGFGLCGAVYGVPFFQNLFLTPRQYETSRAFLKSLPFLLALLPMLLATGWLARSWRQKARLQLLLLAAMAALITGAAERGGIGVDINAHFETLSLLCVLSGVALARVPRALPWLLIPFIVLMPLGAMKSWQDVSSYPARLIATRAMVTQIRALPGPVACEDMAYCYWAGKGYRLDFFLYGQYLLATHDVSALRQAVVSGDISAVQINSARGPQSRISDPLPPLLQGWSTQVLYRSDTQALIALTH